MTQEEIQKRIEKAKADRLKREQEMEQWWDKEHTFTENDDIHDIPITDDPVKKQYYIDRLISFGAIPKNQLIIGHTYYGKCRNSEKAEWDGKKFNYIRNKFGAVYTEQINHFEDDDGYDVFVPIRDDGIL